MAYYTIYVGGERKDRATTEEDVQNVQRTLSMMDGNRCYTVLKDDEGRNIGQAEHVLENLISISYINNLDDVSAIENLLKSVGVTMCAVATCDDEECVNEIAYEDVKLA